MPCRSAWPAALSRCFKCNFLNQAEYKQALLTMGATLTMKRSVRTHSAAEKGCSRQERKSGVAKVGDADFAARDLAVQHSLQGRLLRCLGQQQMRLGKLQRHLERLQMSPAQRQTHRPRTPVNYRLRTHLPQTPESRQRCCRPMYLLNCCCCSLQRQSHRTPPRCLLRTHDIAMSQEQLVLVPTDESKQLLLLLLLLSVPLSFT